jgi:23S rRNA (uracil1939-C5)-methyltransferase
MTPKAIKKVIKLNIPNLIYISCNPSTFARDLKSFKECGYSLYRLYCFDFFPHTGHLEILSILKKL